MTRSDAPRADTGPRAWYGRSMPAVSLSGLRRSAARAVCLAMFAASSAASCPTLAEAAPKALRAPEGAKAITLLLTRIDALGQARWTRRDRENAAIFMEKQAERDRIVADARALGEVSEGYDARVAAAYVEGMAWLTGADVAASLPPPRGLTEADAAAGGTR